jgi:hypothetical protein
LVEGKVLIDEEKCVECGGCTRRCPSGALSVPLRNLERLQIRLADSTKAVLSTFSPGKVVYVNFVVDVMKICDCAASSPIPFIPDVGILASNDIVAIDQASLDMVNKAPGIPGTFAEKLRPGEDKFKALHGVRPDIQIEVCESHGLGTRKYELVEI